MEGHRVETTVAAAERAETVYNAIQIGYRHFDEACDYGNEKEVGAGIARAIREGLVTREELWNGNREPWSNLYSLDPERSIIAWSMTSLAGYRAELAERMSRGEPGNARWVRLTSRREVEGFVARLEGDRGAEG